MDAFYSLIPRELVERFGFSAPELKLLVCGEQHIDITDLRRHCRYDDGYTGREVRACPHPWHCSGAVSA